MPYTLYGSPASYYTAKVKSYLRYKQIAFADQYATIWTYRKVIKPKTGVNFIPVVKTPEGAFLQDSTHIIDTIEKTHPERSVYPTSPKQKLAALLLELFGDEWLLLPAMHYRWSFPDENLNFVAEAFGKTAIPWLPAFLQRYIGKKVGKRFAGFVPLLGINETTKLAIENQFVQLIKALDIHFEQYDFLLGDRPSIADFSFIGPFRAHLFHDPYPKKILTKESPHLVDWIDRMWCLSDANEIKGWLVKDQVPETLNPIFNLLFQDAWPFFEESSKRLCEWLKENPEKSIPRAIGKIDFQIGETQSQRICPTYTQWMLQRPLAYYRSLSTEEQLMIDSWLNTFNAEALIKYKPACEITRINNRVARQQ
ncbi:glutathione S-transferase family protein [Aliikangiella marina]|uniref:Glutathione S-transferase family protein n=1 Tax=Aliikangiella marina TaxID=1712262 RepID=A0A545TJL6_9GAMM|nr:glutathione S-transferase family protein [Aliikangiella marina]TQV77412.1 glutathione S-transferase family protein [Aliikangiella marina]